MLILMIATRRDPILACRAGKLAGWKRFPQPGPGADVTDQAIELARECAALIGLAGLVGRAVWQVKLAGLKVGYLHFVDGPLKFPEPPSGL
jgi:hypothetical protein